MKTSITLVPGDVTLETLQQLYRQKSPAKLADMAKEQILSAHKIVMDAANGSIPVYGVNTGFGKLSSTQIAKEKTSTLQRNLILSHSSGVGEPAPEAVIRLMIALKMLSLGRGASGVQWPTIKLLEDMLEKGVTPIVPIQGSVGASGDLAPLAHMAAVMIGEGEALFNGERISGAAALKAAGLSAITLGPKEGLALINGTQFSTAYALAAFFDTWQLVSASLITGALSTDAAMGSSAPFRAEIHALRGHKGQIQAANTLRELIDKSPIRDSHKEEDDRVQDPYCLRCQPQVIGACLDVLTNVAKTLEIEANAVTDNPLVISSTAEIISGGNFHAEPVAFAADQMALAIAETGAISQRRIAMLVDPVMNFGLPAFLSPDPGINSGFMIAEVTSAALMSENKHAASPASVDSTPTSANQEDHVSMAAHAARRLMNMNENLANIIAIEWLVSVQGIEFRAPLTTSPLLSRAMKVLRNHVPSLKEDRYISSDIEQASNALRCNELNEIIDDTFLPSWKGASQ